MNTGDTSPRNEDRVDNIEPSRIWNETKKEEGENWGRIVNLKKDVVVIGKGGSEESTLAIETQRGGENGEWATGSLMHDIRPTIMGGSTVGDCSNDQGQPIVVLTGPTENAIGGPASALPNCNGNSSSNSGSSSSLLRRALVNVENSLMLIPPVKTSDNNILNSNNCVDKVVPKTKNFFNNCRESEERVESSVSVSESQCGVQRMEGHHDSIGSVNNNNNSFGSSNKNHQISSASSSVAYSTSSSPSSSASSSLSTSPTVQQMAAATTTAVPATEMGDDHRKVEPLIINLNREPIRTVIKLQHGTGAANIIDSSTSATLLSSPKITIKPIPKPEPESVIVNHYNDHYSNNESRLKKAIEFEDVSEVHPIPKLHIKKNHHQHYQAESHEESGSSSSSIVPKLTIRGATSLNSSISNNSSSTAENVVPKLTIKKDHLHLHHHHHHHHHSHHHQKQQRDASPESVKITDDGTKIKIKKLFEPPLPKLTIKTTLNSVIDGVGGTTGGEGDGERSVVVSPIPKVTIKQCNTNPSSNLSSINNSSSVMISPSSCSSSSSISPTSSTAATASSLSPSSTLSMGGATTEHLTVPKLTIKVPTVTTTTAPDIETIPKLTIKTVAGKSDTEEQSFEILNSNNNNNTNSPEEEHPIKKFIVKMDHHQKQHDSDTTTPSIPRLTIKPVIANPKTYGTNLNEFISSSKCISSVQAQGDQGTVPKVTIKPIPKPPEVVSTDDEEKEKEDPPVPLEISTTILSDKTSGPQSPRIILKINKNQNSIVSNTREVENYHHVQEHKVKEENLLKRRLTQDLFANKEQKRTKVEEKIVAVIDLDEEEDEEEEEEEEDDDVIEVMKDPTAEMEEDPLAITEEANHVELKEVMLKPEENGTIRQSRPDLLMDLDASTSSDCMVVLSKLDVQKNGEIDCFPEVNAEDEPKTIVNVPENENLDDEDSTRNLDKEAESKEDQMETETPIKRRGRGRPRKTPLVERKDVEETPTRKKRMLPSKIAQLTKSISSLIQNSIPSTEDEEMKTPKMSFDKSKRGGLSRGRGRGRGTSRRGRGSSSSRKPFNKERYFRQKMLQESISNTAVQLFEEDTRMSADIPVTPKQVTSVVQQDLQDSVSQQSSHLSSASVTMDSNNTTSTTTKKRTKMEVIGTMEGKTEFTVDMLAEYDWPPGVGCCPNKNRDTYMIQEQIVEYLGVKSFKRKYPDLERRCVEMEERNHLIEKGLVTEKMCDLGVTAVYAMDVLDIMYDDFHDKYEEYKQYHREKLAKEFSARQKMSKSDVGLGAREKAMRAVSEWNSEMNKSRLEERRLCMDLQSFVVQVPEAKRKHMTVPVQKPSNYPLALVPYQYSDYYHTYSPLELQCYPINTVLLQPEEMKRKMAEAKLRGENRITVDSSSDSSSDDSDSDSSDCDSTDSSSDSDLDVSEEDPCCVCSKSQFINSHSKPEMFVKCISCKKTAHPSCIEMSDHMARRVRQYLWQCIDCKTCYKCRKKDDKQKMLFCDQCDRSFHIYCTKLNQVPEGRWHCDICSICATCGCRNPNGTNAELGKEVPGGGGGETVQWSHEYRVNDVTKLREHFAMFCIRCKPNRLKENSPSSSSQSKL